MFAFLTHTVWLYKLHLHLLKLFATYCIAVYLSSCLT